jgi:small-conductance mechanosensitive channel
VSLAPLAAASGPLELMGVKLIGMTPENGRKLLLSIVVLIVLPLIGLGLTKLVALITRARPMKRVGFWARQAINLTTGVLVVLILASVWFDDPGRMATVIGLITAGVAVALQRVVTAIGGYALILRGSVFNVGDRIVMGGVRGDVVALGFLQTTVMEMGEAGPEQPDKPAVWVHSRQYTGRLVTVSNAVVFDEPVYNYTRDFPFIFEEMMLPVRYEDDFARAEQILLDAAGRHTVDIRKMEDEAVKELRRRYFLGEDHPGPRVYWRLTDNWLELTVRFVVCDHGVRQVKDAMSRDILRELKAAGIGIASATYELVGAPELKVKVEGPTPPRSPARSAAPPPGDRPRR